jgi:carboxyl-terminal processing protease
MIMPRLFRTISWAVVTLIPLATISGCGDDTGTFTEAPRKVQASGQPESPWKGTGLDFDLLARRVNTQSCQETVARFLACIAAVQALFDTSSRALQLLHADWAAEPGYEHRWIHRFGKLGVVETVHGEPGNVLDEIRAVRKRILAWQASYRDDGMPGADFTRLLEWARETLVRPGQEEHYTAAAINGYLSVKDAHAQILPASQPADAGAPRAAGTTRDHDAHSYTGIGASLQALAGNIIVTGIVPESPASAAGIQASDALLGVDGRAVAHMAVPEVVALLRGVAGTEVSLRLKRQDRTYEVRLRRAPVAIRNVTSSVHKDRYRSWGHLRITTFNSEKTCADSHRELRALIESGVDGLLLDLRDNMGGLVDQAVCVADLFLEPGLLILDIRGTRHEGRSRPLYSHRPAMTEVPIVTLVNAATGSASEALAGALQDHGRSVIIGKRTFGKGTIQTLRPWNDSGTVMLYFTAARMYTPAGRTAQLVGLEPDLPVMARTGEPDAGGTILREQDLFPTALPSPPEQPEPRRYWSRAAIEACLASDGLAEPGRPQPSAAESVRDYPRDVGYDTLHCLHTRGDKLRAETRLAGR